MKKRTRAVVPSLVRTRRPSSRHPNRARVIYTTRTIFMASLCATIASTRASPVVTRRDTRARRVVGAVNRVRANTVRMRARSGARSFRARAHRVVGARTRCLTSASASASRACARLRDCCAGVEGKTKQTFERFRRASSSSCAHRRSRGLT